MQSPGRRLFWMSWSFMGVWGWGGREARGGVGDALLISWKLFEANLIPPRTKGQRSITTLQMNYTTKLSCLFLSGHICSRLQSERAWRSEPPLDEPETVANAAEGLRSQECVVTVLPLDFMQTFNFLWACGSDICSEWRKPVHCSRPPSLIISSAGMKVKTADKTFLSWNISSSSRGSISVVGNKTPGRWKDEQSVVLF